MRVDLNLAAKSLESSKEGGKSSKKGRRRHRKSMQTAVQELFETCRQVFSGARAGVVPSVCDVERLQMVLDNMNPVDVGLSQKMSYFRRIKSKRAQPITYLHLYECEEFSIGIFCLPPSAVIPLHNHPGMTVFSKLLFGTMHIRSYDWEDIPCSSDNTFYPSYVEPSRLRLAKLKINARFTAPCKTSILYPASGGNMHCFTAMTPCAVLDVLGPPYSDSQGRHCTYYQDYPYTSFSVNTELGSEREEGYAWLEEQEKPEEFVVMGAEYEGPQIVEN